MNLKKRPDSKGALRDPLELWLDKHNHKLALIRTIGTIVTIIWAVVRLRGM